MKRLIITLSLSISSLLVFGQKATWKEMQDFHKYMSATFHAAEDHNLVPLKEQSAQMLIAAQQWQKSNVPDGYDAKVAKPILKRLVTQCQKIDKAVKASKSDTELEKMINEGHEIFHEIMEKCQPGKHEH